MPLTMNPLYSSKLLQWHTNLCKPMHGMLWNQALWFMILLNWITMTTSGNISWKRLERLLDDCQILSDADLVKAYDLLTIRTLVNNGIQFSMEMSVNKLSLLENFITKWGKKFGWIFIHSQLVRNAMLLVFLTTLNPVLTIYRFV